MHTLTREQAIQENQGLVFKLAKKFVRPGIDFLDLIQEGNIGLLVAYEKFDPEYGTKFFTYAYWWVFQHIQTFARNNIKPLKQSAPKPKDWREKPEDSAPCFPLNVCSLNNMFLNMKMFDFDIEYFASQDMSEEDIIDFKNIWEKLYLDFDRGYRIVCRHIIEGHTLEAIGDEEGIAKERVRQICVETVEKLQKQLKIKPPRRCNP